MESRVSTPSNLKNKTSITNVQTYCNVLETITKFGERGQNGQLKGRVGVGVHSEQEQIYYMAEMSP